MAVASRRDVETRKAVDRGDSFVDILRDSAGFASRKEAEEYLDYVADKRDRFLKAHSTVLRDISPGLLHKDGGSSLKHPARDYLTYGESEANQYSPILRRSDRGFLDRAFNLESRGRIWKHGAAGTEEEVSLHPFNTLDQRDGNAETAAFFANIFAPVAGSFADITTNERYLNSNAGTYEQLRLVELQRAMAGLKRHVLTYVNHSHPDSAVSSRADMSSQIVRNILHKSRMVYEQTEGSPIEKDRAVFAMLRQDFGAVLPNGDPTPDSTGFPQHVTSAVRAYATLPARARGDGGLYNKVLSVRDGLSPQLSDFDLIYFQKALDLQDDVIKVNHQDSEGSVDLIDATADASPIKKEGGPLRNVRAAEGGGKSTTWTWETYRWNPEAKGGQKVDPRNIKGTGRSFDAAKERLKVPEGRKAEFEKWMDGLANLPKEIEVEGRKVPIQSFLVPKDWRTNTDYNRDYDYVAAFLANAEPGPLDHGPEEGWFWHMGDAGKMPTHPTFSVESYYAKDPRWADLAGSWEGETYIPGKAERNVRQDALGGDAGAAGAAVPEAPVSEAPQNPGGPRIVLNPQVFSDKRDALCVAFNEAFRLVMEENGFEPVSEPTEAQRKFFADTAYANDELQLRRTILARIATLDTSVKDPTDEQLEETAEMLEMVMEVGAPQNEWEQSAVQRLHDMVVRMRESPRSSAPTERPKETGSAQAAEGAGVTMTGSELDFLRRRYESGASMNARQRAIVEAANAQGVRRGVSGFVNFSLNPPDENAQTAQPMQPAQQPTVTVTATGGGPVDWNGRPTSGAGMYVPNEDELAFLRRRRDSGASLSLQQRRILELMDGNNLT